MFDLMLTRLISACMPGQYSCSREMIVPRVVLQFKKPYLSIVLD